MTDQKEQIIIKNVVAGDIQAFAELVNAYKDMSVLLAYNIMLNQEDAEEEQQDGAQAWAANDIRGLSVTRHVGIQSSPIPIKMPTRSDGMR